MAASWTLVGSPKHAEKMLIQLRSPIGPSWPAVQSPAQHQPGKHPNQGRLWVWAYLPLSPYIGGQLFSFSWDTVLLQDGGWDHLLRAVTGPAKGPSHQPGQLLASRCLYCVKPGPGGCWESVGRGIHREIATFCLKLGHEKLVIDRIIASFLIPTAKIQVEEPINLLTETF